MYEVSIKFPVELVGELEQYAKIQGLEFGDLIIKAAKNLLVEIRLQKIQARRRQNMGLSS